MDLLISGGILVTGDGITERRGNLWIEGGRIAAVDFDDLPSDIEVAEHIVADGFVVAPGAINNHAHGCSVGPLFSSGAPALSLAAAQRIVDRYFLQGHTTLLNLCGLTTMEDVRVAAERSPARVCVSTVHLPNSMLAADDVDGVGMKAEHRALTAHAMIEQGAVAIGEVGGGHTLGGGGQDYQYIPARIKEELGVAIDATTARELKMSILGAEIFGDDQGAAPLEDVLAAHDLGELDVDRVRQIVSDAVLPPIQHALAGFREAAALAAQTGVPAIFHSSSACARELIGLARKYSGNVTLVAGHSNHNTYTVEAAVETARTLREEGVVIDVSSLDGVITHWRNDTERIDALAAEGLIDTLSTDYGNGHWDSMFELAHHLIDGGFVTRPQAVAMATGNVARHLPQLAGGRGLLEPGRPADIAILDQYNLGRVESLVVNGRTAVRSGRTAW
jgi:predicted amidohydrolase